MLDSHFVEQAEPMPLVVEKMDNPKGEAADIFSQVREREKRIRLEADLFKTTQLTSGTYQEALTVRALYRILIHK